MRLLKLVPDNTNFKFLKLRVPFYVISCLLIAASWALVMTKGLNYGVDFAGGQEVRVTFVDRAEAPLSELREELSGLGLGDPAIQRFGEANSVSIRISLPKGVEDKPGAATEIGNRVIASIDNKFHNVRRDANETVSGKVAAEFREDGSLALLLAMLAISIYIWVRFEWQFGVGALFALFHDVSLAFGMFALFQLEFSLQIIAAILTIIGYSLNDTIVVYDRIRENLKKYRKMPLPELLDLSVNETLSRTVMTSLTVLVALIPLLLFGPASLFGLTAAITLGIFVGTYSSIYMAAPILIWTGVKSDSFVPTESAAERQDRIARGEA
jgi:preprotein translocase subunit SecF